MMMIGRHLGTIAATTEDDSQRILTCFNGISQGMDHVGIVDTLRTIGAIIIDLITGLRQSFNQILLHLETTMVARDGDDLFHYFLLLIIQFAKLNIFVTHHRSIPLFLKDLPA